MDSDEEDDDALALGLPPLSAFPNSWSCSDDDGDDIPHGDDVPLQTLSPHAHRGHERASHRGDVSITNSPVAVARRRQQWSSGGAKEGRQH